MSRLLSDGAQFETECEFYCTHCGDFRDVLENQNDIVCRECHSVIATYRMRPIFSRDAYRAGYNAAMAEKSAQ